MCRSGIITYGMLPSDECEGRIDLKPLMTLKTTIGLVKHVPAGSQLSYGRTYTAETDRVIATVPIGYADGYNRNLSNDARMLVNGKFAPVVGRICMDQCMLDVTDIPDVKMVESKSLKLYLFSFRNHGAFHEDCVNIIMKDLIRLMAPKYIEVTGIFTPRGGISIYPYCNYGRPGTKYEGLAEQRLFNHQAR